MVSSPRARWPACAAAAVLLGLAPTEWAAVRADDKTELQQLRERLEALERQNEALMRLVAPEGPVQRTQAGAVADPKKDEDKKKDDDKKKDEIKKVVDEVLKKKDDDKKKDEEKKKKEADDKGFTVGDDLGMTLKWDHGLWAETKDKAFRVHVGGRTQFDTVWYNAPANVQYGNNGVGRVDDAAAFRRARFAVEGSFWEVIGFNMEYDFLNSDTLAQNINLTQTRNAAGAVTNVTANRVGRIIDTPVPTDLWVELRQLPVVKNFRIGNFKAPISFEHLTSSRFLNFIERSYGFDAFSGGPDNGFQPGFMLFRNFADDRIHVATALQKFNQSVFGFNTGDGDWMWNTRIGGFPLWEREGEHALWVGLGYQHADPDFIATGNRQFSPDGSGQVRLRARTLLRNGPAELHTPLLDIFPFGSSRDLLVPEIAYVCGPWSMVAEYYAHWLHDARDTATGPNKGTQYTQSAYVEVLYFLTGEHRVFNRMTPGFTRVVPHENYFLVKDGCGSLFGRGAWQVGARYSWVDLADKNVLGGNNTIGQAQGVTLGLNWFLNPNLKLQWNYTYEDRYQVNRVTTGNTGLLPGQNSTGELHGFGMRMAMDF